MDHRKLLIWAVLLLFVLPLTGQINVSITSDAIICEGESIQLDANPSGGDGNYTYLWTPAVGLSCTDCLSPIASPTVTTTYTLTVEDGLGEQGSASVTVTVAPPVPIQANVQDINCNGANSGFILINNSGNWTYEWSNGNIGPVLQGLSAGTYCVTVTNDNGCTNEECFTVTEPPLLQAFAETTNTTCSGLADGTITVTVTGGTAPYAYIWNNGSTTASQLNLPAGTYSITLVDANGCTVVTTATVLEDPSFTVEIDGLPTEPCVTDFTLQAVTDGGSENFTYLWEINGVVASTTTELVNPAPGQITLTVTNENSCSVTQVVNYDPSPLVDINTSGILSCATGSVVLDGSGSTTGPDYTYQWTGPNGFTSNQLIATVSAPGVYTLTVNNTSVAGCSNSSEVTVTDLTLDFGDGIFTSVLGCNDYRLQGIIPANYFGQLAFEWTFPDGVTTSTEMTITPTQTGVYTLRTEAVGLDCNFYSTVFIDLDAETCAKLNGFVHQDDNEDCAPDPADLPLEGWEVIATDGVSSYIAFTDSEGYYELNVPISVNSVTLIAPSASWEICLATVELTPSLAEGEVRNVDFQVKALVECPELDISLSANFLRRCFSSYYYITVTNTGTEEAVDAEVTLVLDDFISYLNSSITPIGIVDQTVVWNVGTLSPNQTVSFWVQVFVSCNAQLGQTHCSEVSVTPNPLCAPTQNWSGTNLELEADCNGTDVIFTVRNTSTNDLAEPIHYIVIEDGVAMMQSQIIEDLGGDQVETFLFPANGATYTFQLDQVENHPYSEQLSLSIEGCGVNGQNNFSTGFVNQFSQTTATISNDVFCLENVGSYDPNDKAALPIGYGEQHYIVPETELYYRIRFQNTGTDTAFTVVIRDVLSEDLDLRTIDLGVSSHQYTAAIDANRALTFTFNNILLPDSTTNLEASQGFVDFRISPDVNAPLETIIENDAAIYFDFNEPVITNTVFHTLGRNFLEVVNTEIVPGVAIQWNIFPNPVADQLQLQLSGEDVPERLLLQVLDAQGRLLRQASFSGNTHSLSVADLPAGWYQLRLTLTNGDLLGTAKLVKK